MYSIRKIDRLMTEDIEYLGTKRKFWFKLEERRYLFKAEERGTGEDWAEKVVCELAGLLGIPHVEYELAHEFEGTQPVQPGVICPTFVPRPFILVLGNQLLLVVDSSYPSGEERRYGIREYTVDAVAWRSLPCCNRLPSNGCRPCRRRSHQRSACSSGT